jgi:hypothetical protein
MNKIMSYTFLEWWILVTRKKDFNLEGHINRKS